jgi:hypothetical protein
MAATELDKICQVAGHLSSVEPVPNYVTVQVIALFSHVDGGAVRGSVPDRSGTIARPGSGTG